MSQEHLLSQASESQTEEMKTVSFVSPCLGLFLHLPDRRLLCHVLIAEHIFFRKGLNIVAHLCYGVLSRRISFPSSCFPFLSTLLPKPLLTHIDWALLMGSSGQEASSLLLVQRTLRANNQRTGGEIDIPAFFTFT